MNKLLLTFLVITYKIFGYCIIFPITFFIPRKKNLILFIGKESGEFSGNLKYMYAFLHTYCQKDQIEFYFIASNKNSLRIFKENGLPALFFQSLKAWGALLKANIAFVDTNRWQHEFKYFLLRNCHMVQLWHGLPIKKIGSHAYSSEKFFQGKNLPLYIYTLLREWAGSFYTYSCFCSTSDFYTSQVYKQIFKAESFLNFGQPRNDIFKSDVLNVAADLQAIKRILEFKKDERAIVYYLPTFRDGERVPLKGVLISELCRIAHENNFIWLLKLHPKLSAHNNPELKNILHDDRCPIIVYDSLKDIHCCLNLADILVTDYSSVYFDFLFFDKPILFFNYDYEQYTQNIRNLAFDYEQWTPGPKCQNQSQLENAIKDILAGKADIFKAERKRVFTKAFDYHDGNASQRIWSKIRDEYLPQRKDNR